MKIARWEALALCVILIAAVVARAVGLNAGLWYDEIFTLTHYVREPLGLLLRDFSSLNNHMFYSVQAKGAVALFGESAWALRLPAAVFGVASIVLTWAMARAPAGRMAALLSALLLAISYHHVWFSQNARGYTGMLFWTGLATLLLIKGLKRPDWRVWTGFGLSIAAGIYTHLSAGFFFAAVGLVYALAWLLRGTAAFRRYPGLSGFGPIYGFATGGILTLLLHIPMLSQMATAVNKVSRAGGSSAMAEWVDPFRAVREIMFSMGPLGPLAPLALWGGLAVFVTGAAALWRREPILVGIYAISLPLTLALLLALNFRIWPRYFFVDIGFVLLCAALGTLVLCRWAAAILRAPGMEKPLIAVAITGATIASLVLLARNYAHPKQDFDGAIRFVRANAMPGDIATSAGLASEPVASFLAPSWPVAASVADLDALRRQSACIWMVTAFDDRVGGEQKPLLAEVRRSFVLARAFPGTLGGGTVKVYRTRRGCPPRGSPALINAH